VTVDTRDDYERVSALYDRLFHDNPMFGMAELEKLHERDPDLLGPAAVQNSAAK
jgi:spore coat polysaccharide biosynthesis protein SpsF (cytidylyltransferase family)